MSSDKQTVTELKLLIEQYKMRRQVAQTDLRQPGVWQATKKRYEKNIAELQQRLELLIEQHSDPQAVIDESTVKIAELTAKIKLIGAGGQETVDKKSARLLKLKQQIAALESELGGEA